MINKILWLLTAIFLGGGIGVGVLYKLNQIDGGIEAASCLIITALITSIIAGNLEESTK